MPDLGRRRCAASTFDRTLCYCEPGGTMHTFVCVRDAGHLGEHIGREGICSCQWTNREALAAHADLAEASFRSFEGLA